MATTFGKLPEFCPDSGYTLSNKKHALCVVPKDEALSVQWAESDPAPKLLQEYYAVCVRHFYDRYICRHFEHAVKG
ncbi:hypothetical protein HPB50_005303 [Hyalomma asiaticum]|uniref:Uncharacterized protein n=1 Tax=Hyalomma asiaticum TaxID=266040 RepID=A0ACB7TIY6_HYAAI|nr:hypothetical protein HPB50_005303 [Hyalomma asiaticum]